jgi:hypothetical protein
VTEALYLPFRDRDSDHEGSDARDEVHGPQQTECEEPELLASLWNVLGDEECE